MPTGHLFLAAFVAAAAAAATAAAWADVLPRTNDAGRMPLPGMHVARTEASVSRLLLWSVRRHSSMVVGGAPGAVGSASSAATALDTAPVMVRSTLGPTVVASSVVATICSGG